MLKKRIPHLDLLEMLPWKIDLRFFNKFTHENIEELLEVDILTSVKREDLYYGAESDSEDTILMLTPLHCKYIIEKLTKHFCDDCYDQ